MQISEYPKADASLLTGDENFVIQRGIDTLPEALKLSDLTGHIVAQVPDPPPSLPPQEEVKIPSVMEMLYSDQNIPLAIRKRIPRGKNLGSEFTEAQRKAVRDGSFTDIFIGDYWEHPDLLDPWLSIGTNKTPIKWVVVDLDYGYNTTDGLASSTCLTHHVMIMPERPIQMNVQYHSTSKVVYNQSDIKKYVNGNSSGIKDMIKTMFGVKNDGLNRVVTWYAGIDTSGNSSTGFAESASIREMTIDLPSINMLYGPFLFPKFPDPATVSTMSLLRSKSYLPQLALFSVQGDYLINTNRNGSYWWLQDQLYSYNNAIYMAQLSSQGYLYAEAPTNYAGVLPIFAIGGED